MRNVRLVVAALPLSACMLQFGYTPSAWLTERDAFEIERGTFTGVSCATHNGEVAVAASDDGQKVLVRVKKTVGARSDADARAAMDALEVTHQRVDGKLVLGWRWKEWDSSWRADVAFDITQPRDLSIEAETHNGDVRATGFAAAVTMRSHNGSLRTLDCSGKLEAETHNGEIVARSASTELALCTHNGAVQATLAGAGPVRGSVTSHNGPIHIEIDGDRSGRLVCHTYNGGVACARPLARLERGRDFLVGDLGDGEGRLEVRSHNGSIRVN